MIDRAAVQREVDMHMIGNRRGCGECLDKLGTRVDRTNPFVDLAPVPQSLNPSRRRTRPDRHQEFRIRSNASNPFRVVGCRDRPFDECHVIRPGLQVTARFSEMRDLDSVADCEQFVLCIEQR